MDTIEKPRPLSLDGNLSENWRRFFQAWQVYYSLKTHGQSVDDRYKTSLFLHVVGEDAAELYHSFSWTSDGDEWKLEKVIEKYETYCADRDSDAMHVQRFFNYKQDSGQTIDSYVIEVKSLAKKCPFEPIADKMVKFRIMCGLSCESLRERLFREKNDVSLEKVIQICRVAEAAAKQARELKESEGLSVNSLQRNSRRHDESANSRSNTQECSYCGYQHKPGSCPAYGKTCRSCNGRNHFAKVCPKRLRNVRLVQCDLSQVEDHDSHNFFVAAVSDRDKTSMDTWKFSLNFHGKALTVKLDTAADVNVMSECDLNSIAESPPKEFTKVRLTAYGGNQIPLTGRTSLDVTVSGQIYSTMWYITSAIVPPLLGGVDCLRLGLVKRVCSVNDISPASQIPEAPGLRQRLLMDFQSVFEGLGCLPGHHTIRLDPSIPPVVEPCRKIPFAMFDRVKAELDRMVQLGVAAKVTEPTDWVSAMVVIPKKNGEIRLCIDPRNLNKAIKREHFPQVTREELMARFSSKKFFTKLDARHGFWQVKLDEASSFLCTIATPFGRYRFLRLPFGIRSAPEVFDRVVKTIFEDIPDVNTSMDDIVIASVDLPSHERTVREVLQRCKETGLTLGMAKCQFGLPQLVFIGELITKDGVKPDPDKIKAVHDMERPKCVKDVERFLGLVNYLARFIPDMSTIAAPLNQLRNKNTEWIWESTQEIAWKKLKDVVVSSPVLQFFDPRKEIKISSDASQSGLGAVLLQLHDDKWLPVAYASRSMTTAETRYAQIEKETLAMTFACERFDQYIYGGQFLIETDHKPLVSIFQKPLNDCPARLQRFRLRLQKYDFTMIYTPGHKMFVADTLSRSLPKGQVASSETDQDIEGVVAAVMASLPISDDRLDEIRDVMQSDMILQLLKRTILEGWPGERKNCPVEIVPYWNFRDELVVMNDLIFKGSRVVIPYQLRSLMLKKIHEGHLGREKCKRRARQVLFWPGMNTDIDNLVESCSICLSHRPVQQAEPLLPHAATECTMPWEKVATDLMNIEHRIFLLVVDYYSCYPEVVEVSNASSVKVIQALKAVFARHGVPRILVSDNGPCYSSTEFKKFAESWDFRHVTSSPHYPQSNGMAENGVKNTKNLLLKAKEGNEDPLRALLIYRSSPLECGKSPSELLMGRTLRSNLPIAISTSQQTSQQLDNNHKVQAQEKQEKYYNRNTKPLSTLHPGDSVRIRIPNQSTWSEKGTVVKAVSPRSYIIDTDNGNLRRNRRHLLLTSSDVQDWNVDDDFTSGEKTSEASEDDEIDKQVDIPRRSKRKRKKPVRLIETL